MIILNGAHNLEGMIEIIEAWTPSENGFDRGKDCRTPIKIISK